MKKSIVTMTALAALSLGYMYTKKQPQMDTKKSTEERTAEKAQTKWKALREEVNEIIEQDKSITEAKRRLNEKRKSFQSATDFYNEKAIKGLVTESDEKQYQVSMRESIEAFEDYQNAVLKELNLKKEN